MYAARDYGVMPIHHQARIGISWYTELTSSYSATSVVARHRHRSPHRSYMMTGWKAPSHRPDDRNRYSVTVHNNRIKTDSSPS